MAYRWMIDELHVRLRERGWSDVRPSYGFVLLVVRSKPVTPTALAAELGVTKQAASKLADIMVDAGLLSRVVDDHDTRQRLLALDHRGHALLAEVERIYDELESELAELIGSNALEQTRTRLARIVLATHGEQFPTIRPSP
jgi:DNA-binding MarR family transcriptional regulator